MKNTTKKIVSDLLVIFDELPEETQLNIICVTYGAKLAASVNGGNKNDRAADIERMARIN